MDCMSTSDAESERDTSTDYTAWHLIQIFSLMLILFNFFINSLHNFVISTLISHALIIISKT